ncbi:hypothetical protein PVAP13_1NG526919 [Panicum virgatum]|uniref:Uncharacterized protein n=1 Tax=Panicum virgatum TaxID=38727 RepID=A0A8T0XBY7_PANVG|nr:hypothetical protein PVAP13_1NG526919 [Panicum virgatum]
MARSCAHQVGRGCWFLQPANKFLVSLGHLSSPVLSRPFSSLASSPPSTSPFHPPPPPIARSSSCGASIGGIGKAAANATGAHAYILLRSPAPPLPRRRRRRQGNQGPTVRTSVSLPVPTCRDRSSPAIALAIGRSLRLAWLASHRQRWLHPSIGRSVDHTDA